MGTQKGRSRLPIGRPQSPARLIQYRIGIEVIERVSAEIGIREILCLFPMRAIDHLAQHIVARLQANVVQLV